MRLPLPDPFESLGLAPDRDMPMPGPVAVFLAGPPGPEAERLSDAILALRPGALIVISRD